MATYEELRAAVDSLQRQLDQKASRLEQLGRERRKATRQHEEALAREQLYRDEMRRMCVSDLVSMVDYKAARESMLRNKKLVLETRNDLASKNLAREMLEHESGILRGLLETTKRDLASYGQVREFRRP